MKKDSLDVEQLAHFSSEEKTAIDELVTILAERGSEPEADPDFCGVVVWSFDEKILKEEAYFGYLYHKRSS